MVTRKVYIMVVNVFMVLMIFQIITKTSCVLDITCFSNNARININGDDRMFIGGYKSGDDRDASISFGRTSDTGTGDGLPTGYSINEEHPSPSVSARRLLMPSSGGVERIGAFYCQAEKAGETERITTIIMAENSDITPQHISQTVSIGESVTFTIETSKSALRWWHNNIQYNGNDNRPNWNDMTSVTIPRVTVNDAGVYECSQFGLRENGKHAIFQLVVRACETGKWGDTCQLDCPHCFNGGICDERSGECVCAPGFSGVRCQTVYGRNKWGGDGQLRCAGIDDHGYGCQGRLLCLPHPYGCSCAAGFIGIDCDEECEAGSYGANCRSECHCADGVSCLKDTGECDGGQCHPDWYGVNCQECEAGSYGANCRSECHCADGVSCLKDTGECDGGQCHPDWYGVNCQEPCPDPQEVSNLQATAYMNSIVLQWGSAVSPCADDIIDYVVEYRLINMDQCIEPTPISTKNFISNGASFTLSNLAHHSTYMISVTARRNTLRLGPTTSVSLVTQQAEPTSPPSDVTAYNTSSDEISIRWSQPPCGSRNGPIVSYAYTLSTVDGALVMEGATESSDISLGPLTPFTDYTFSVAAMTESGLGPAYTMVVSTKPAAPSAPRMLQVVVVSKQTIQVSWEEPEHPNGIISKYTVRGKVIDKPYDLLFVPSADYEFDVDVLNAQQRTYRIQNLKPSTQYEIQVAAHSEVGEGDSVTTEQFTDPVTKEDIPTPSALPEISSNQITSSNIEIRIPESSSEFVSGYQIGVDLETNEKETDATSFQEKINSPPIYFTYVAAELPKHDVKMNPMFVIGDDNTYGGYSNPPLHDGYTYTLYTAYYSRVNKTSYVVSWSEGTEVTLTSLSATSQAKSTPEDSGVNTVTIAVFTCVIVLMAIVIVVLVLKMRSNYKEMNNLKQNHASSNAMTGVASSDQIKMSSDGYVKYKVEGRETTYQDVESQPDDQEATYQDIRSELSPTGETQRQTASENAAYETHMSR
ncbi:uncharacterized protein [Amphiura filiformis]|uniref:uncharacterized protein n=1 Tax=Amphiura filiformis TaxID=82378 RepID=UPI003B211BC2